MRIKPNLVHKIFVSMITKLSFQRNTRFKYEMSAPFELDRHKTNALIKEVPIKTSGKS